MASGKGFCQSRNAGHARAPRSCAASRPAGDHWPMPGLLAVQLYRLRCGRGLARLQEKPSRLSSVLHTSSRGTESREWRENLFFCPTPNLAPLNPLNPVQPKQPRSHLQAHSTCLLLNSTHFSTRADPRQSLWAVTIGIHFQDHVHRRLMFSKDWVSLKGK